MVKILYTDQLDSQNQRLGVTEGLWLYNALDSAITLEVLEAIKPLKFLGNDLIVFHVLDPAEIDFGYEDASSFEDLESGEQIPVVPESLAAEYRSMIGAHIEALTTRFSEHRIDYTLLNTAEPLDRALFSYLSTRERLMRVR